MSVVYNFRDAAGNIVNTPWDQATGRDNTYIGRADGQEQNPWYGYTTASGGQMAQAQRDAAQNAGFSGFNGGGMATFGGAPAAAAAPAQPQPYAGMQGPAGTLAPGAMNPFLAQMGKGLSDQMQTTFNRTTLPGIASNAAASGGYGSSRQGVLEANALNDFTQNQGKALTDLYGQGYSQGLNYDLGVRGNNTANAANANAYDLGLRNNDLAYANLDRTINNDNLSWQAQGAQMGLNANGALQAGNATGLTAGNNMMNTPLNYWQQFQGAANSIGNGFAASSTGMQGSGSPLMGAMGGAQLGSSLWNSYNRGGGGANVAAATGGGGLSGGSMFGADTFSGFDANVGGFF